MLDFSLLYILLYNNCTHYDAYVNILLSVALTTHRVGIGTLPEMTLLCAELGHTHVRLISYTSNFLLNQDLWCDNSLYVTTFVHRNK